MNVIKSISGDMSVPMATTRKSADDIERKSAG